ncbi:MAG: site-2 protease family protein, partial [Chloroflexi bacterium]
HELGHYFVARHYKMEVTLPYFIPFFPFPFGIGTMGAVIRMKSPMTSRKALFDVGLAGPIAGLLVAIPVLIIGLRQSVVVPARMIGGDVTLLLGEPLLYKAISRLVLGPLPDTVDVALNPIAFAGWVGLFVTAMNLLPAGQLDGGHIAYAVWGRAHRLLAQTTFVGLIAMGIGPFFLNMLPGVGPVPGWSGWLIWALLLSVFGLRHPPALDDVTPLTGPRRIAGIMAIALLVLLITPVPFSVQ